MRADEPMGLDDDASPPLRRSRRPPNPDAGGREFWRILKWLAFSGGLLCIAIAFFETAIHATTLAGFACFCAIASRLAQAEEHRFPR